MTAFESPQSEMLRERCLANARLSSQKDVLATSEKLEREKLLVEGAVDAAGMIPVEFVEHVTGPERGGAGASCEVARVALTLLDRAELFDDLGGGIDGFSARGSAGRRTLLVRAASRDVQAGRRDHSS